MNLTEPTRSTREFIRLRDNRNDELWAFIKPVRRSERKRRAAIKAGKDRALTDKQRLGK